MPIYEFRCRACRRRFSVLTLRVGEAFEAVCDRCGSKAVERLLSRFAMPKSEEARLDSLSDPSNLAGLDENDPKSVARWMRKMGKELGDEFAGEDFDEMIDEIEASAGDEESGEEAGDEEV